MSVITNIATALPAYRHPQADLSEFTSELFQYKGKEKRKLQIMYERSGISSRYSVIPDFSSSVEDRIFFPKTSNLEPFPNIEFRMQFFRKTALELCIQVINNCIKEKNDLNKVTHLITVSCTGMCAPGLDIDIVQHLNLSENINRTSINFMGCYAAIHALKQADYICKSDPHAIVLIVCVELCTIHFQKIEDPDNITANLLFADGAAAVLVVPDSLAAKNNYHGFQIEDFHSQITLNGKSDMAWQLSSTGFLMTLSSYIPLLIEKGIAPLFKKALDKLGLQKQDINHWAIHPGGRKILEVIQKELELERADLDSSYNILRNYGNMSSPTVLFVLKDIWETKINRAKPELTFGVAFGPGLTMETVILKNV